jgi:hypothetical protein
MSTLSQFTGGGATKTIVNACSTNGYTPPNLSLSVSGNGIAREVLSGAMTANTLKTVLTVNAAGVAPVLVVYTTDATSRTVRVVITVDGAVVLDSTSAAVANANRGCLAAGAFGWNGAAVLTPGPPIRWAQSLTVQIASSLTETDKLALGYSIN